MMNETISISAVYDKNLNFLFGSGASHGLLPTLALRLKTESGEAHTVETLVTSFEESDPRRIAVLMHFYAHCVIPAQKLTRDSVSGNAAKESVLANYEQFVRTVLHALMRRKPLERRCNIFTTNYDPCFELVSDELLRSGALDFVINDGARGFTKRYLQARNFSTYLCQTGIFERDQTSIPQLNLIHLHGSVHWQKAGSSISVDYADSSASELLGPETVQRLTKFSDSLQSDALKESDLEWPTFVEGEAEAFWSSYKKLPIVNPTKWKFHETVFDEHYYQMLRLLSYELEKPNAVLITFGFSFADEHILNLIKRSLANPKLQVFVCCFSVDEATRLGSEFNLYPNVKLMTRDDGPLDFDYFNSHLFSLGSQSTDATNEATEDDAENA